MARLDDIERRLLNWARWRASQGSGGPLGYAAIRLGGEGVGQREAYREARIPISECEATETEDAVMGLPAELRATVIVVYTGSGSQANHLAELAIGLTTLKARVGQAHRWLAGYFAERQRQAEAERARVERLQRVA